MVLKVVTDLLYLAGTMQAQIARDDLEAARDTAQVIHGGLSFLKGFVEQGLTDEEGEEVLEFLGGYD